MTPNSMLGGIEQILLFVFMLMILVGIAGGNPSTVLQPLFAIAGQLASTLLSLISKLVLMIVQGVCTLIFSGFNFLIATTQSIYQDRINKENEK